MKGLMSSKWIETGNGNCVCTDVSNLNIARRFRREKADVKGIDLVLRGRQRIRN